MTILFAATGWDPAPWLQRLRALLPDHPIVTPQALSDRAAVRYAVCWRPRPGALADLPNLQAIFSLGAGVDHLFQDPRLPQVPIVRVVDPDLTARMSEWVVLHALLHLRQFRRYERQQRERVWDDDDDQPAAGQVRVGILGLGELGRDAARKLRAIGFDVAGWSASAKSEPGVACFHGSDGLDAMLARTDIVVSLLPLTEATRGILNARLFVKLARDGRLGGPILLNAGRGGLQNEADILAALDAGVLKGASLDVFEKEPLPRESRLWTHPAVFVSPHNAAVSMPGAVAGAIARQIEAFERGEGLRNVVDRGRGY
ncbi:MAG: glyoxylate/hydroxypyruvate reductase A [Roseiarcus sp.]|jgi:glyoxylate/hydroxypyruvate reductase A